MNGLEFIIATDKRQYYIESFLKAIIYGYQTLLDSKKLYSRAEIHEIIKVISKSDKAYNEIEDYLCTELVNNHIKPCLHQFGLDNLVVNVGVRETKNSVTVGHLDIKFQVPSLASNHYYAFEAKRLDKSAARKNYYIKGGIERFTTRQYYPETDTVVAGMIGFVEIDLVENPSGRISLSVLKTDLNSLISSYTKITTTQVLTDYKITDKANPYIDSFNFAYISKHTRDEDKQELKIYHLFLDYYDILLN